MTPGSVLSSLKGSVEIAQFDEAALKRFDLTSAGYWRSFSVVLIAVPLLILLLYLQNTYYIRMEESHNRVDAFVLIYLLDWIVFTLLMLPISRMLGVADNYGPFITVYNWCRPIAICFTLVVYAAAATGTVSPQLMTFLGFIGFTLRSAYLGYGMHVTLRIGIGAIFALLLLDIITGMFLIEIFARFVFAAPAS